MAAQSPQILIVDDDRVNVTLLDAVLKGEGYQTLSAQDGAGAFEVAKSELPDLILLDVMMPDIGGFEACTRLKQDSQTTDIPVIFISAIDDVDSKVKGLDIGAVDYITKPFNREEVAARVRLHLRLSEAYKSSVHEQADRLEQLHDAQQAILVQPRDIPEANFGVRYVPIHEAGGDFYDVIAISENIFSYFVADTSGHNVGASFTTAALKALFAQHAGPTYTPIETMKHINSVLNTMMSDGSHVTACYANLNRVRSQLQIISAGHPPVIYLAAKGRPQWFNIGGDVLGAFERVCFEPMRYTVSEGDRFFIYSDGLIEQFGNSKKARDEGIRRLNESCLASRDLPIAESVDAIYDEIFGEDKPDDDVVLLGVEV